MTPHPDMSEREPEPSGRERLLAAALELFTTRGYAATTVREIVLAAGVTKPVLYYHFQSKEGIYLALVQGGMAGLDTLLADARARAGSAPERLRALLGAIYDFFLDHRGEARLMYAMYYGPPQGAPFFDFDRLHDAVLAAVGAIIADGAAEGTLRPGPPPLTALVALAPLSLAIEQGLCHPERPFGRDEMFATFELVLQGLAAAPAARPGDLP